MKALILTLTITIGFVLTCAGQKKSVVIGTMIDKPNAILVINPPNSDQGFLLPQLNTTERLSIAPSSPDDDGLMVYDITEKSFYYWSSNAWVKGLGDATSQVLSYDAATQVLTLSGGGQVNLTTLKEIPTQTGNTGKFLTTNGTTLSWADIGTFGDISSVIAGAGLTGGGTTGDINIAVNTDNASVEVNGSNQLQIKDAGVTTSKVATGAITNVQIANETITSGNILNGTIATSDLDDQSVTPQKIQPSGINNQVLVTIGGTVAWADQSSLPLNLTVDSPLGGDGSAGNHLRILNDGITDAHIAPNAVTASELADNAVDENSIAPSAVSTGKIQDGAISEVKLGPNSVTTTKIQPGANNQVLVTNGSGATEWVNQSTIIPPILTDGATLVGNGTTINLAVGIITGANITDNTLSGAEIADATLGVGKIQPGTPNQVMITNGGGTVQWVDPATLAQPVNTDGVTITGDGTVGNDLQVGVITSGNIQDGTIITDDIGDAQVSSLKIADGAATNNKIGPDAISTDKIAPDAVTSLDILDKAVTLNKIANGTANQVLVTNGAGTAATWTDQSNLVANIFVDAATIVGNGTSGNPLAVGVIQTNDINDFAVTTIKINDGAVNSQKILDGTIQNTDLDAGIIQTQNIQDGAVTLPKILPGAANQVLVTNPTATAVQWTDQNNLIPNIAVDAATIVGNGTVGSPLEVGVIQTDDMNDDAVTTLKIANNAVTNGKLNADAVTTDKIATDGVTTTDIINEAITNQKLGADAITTDKIQADAVTAADILDKAVTPNKILNGTANQVLVTNGAGTAATWTDQSNLIPNIVVDAATIIGNGTAGNPLTVGVIQTGDIADDAVTTVKIANNAITNGKLDADAVTTDKIATDGITTPDILNAAITNSKIDADAITSDKIQADAVTSSDILDKAVTPNKILNGTANQVLVTNGAGTAATWTDQSNLIPNIVVDAATIIGNGTAGNPLTVGVIQTADINDDAVTTLKIANSAVTNEKLNADAVTTDKIAIDGVTTPDIINAAITNPKLGADAVTTDKIQADAVTTPDILDKAVTTDKILNGTANQVLVTNGAGTAATWTDQSNLIPNIVVDAATIIGNGTAGNPLTVGVIQTADINDDAVTTLKIANSAVTNGKLNADAVTTDKIATDGVTTPDIINAAITNPKLGADAVTTDKIQADAVTTPDILDKAVTTSKILNGTANQVLVTNGAGTAATWTDQSNLIPNIVVDAATIIGNGTAGNPLTVGVIQTADINDDAVTTLKIANSAVTNAKLNADAVTTDKIQANAVQNSDILDDAVTPNKIQQGTANQILATDGTGANTLWIDRGTLPSLGDVTGTLAATTVARIQGRDVSNAAPANGQALIWNSTNSAWEPATVTVSPTTQYYSIDPAGFQALQSGTTNNNMLGLFESNDSFVIPLNAARELVAPVYLPHGATITNISVTYVDNELTNMRFALERKPFATAAAEIGSFTTGLLTVAVTTDSFTVPVVGDRLVDNNTYTYRIHITFNSLLDVSSAALALSRIHGVKITYSK